MKKILFILAILIVSPVHAEEYSYVSPESYAVNEADLLDYMSIPRSPRPNIDELDKHIKHRTVDSRRTSKEKSIQSTNNKKPYEKTMKYKAAKWWVDQSYKREEEHHGTKHEIKVQTRLEKEKQESEKKVVDN